MAGRVRFTWTWPTMYRNLRRKMRSELQTRFVPTALATYRRNTPKRTGYLRSTESVRLAPGPNPKVIFEAAAPYAIWVDRGTPRMAPRRFTQRTLDQVRPLATKIIDDVVNFRV